MCLGDIRLMPWVVGSVREVSITTSWTEVAPKNTTRVGLLFLPHETTNYFVRGHPIAPTNNNGIVIASGGQPPMMVQYADVGRYVQIPWFARVGTGNIMVTLVEFTVTQEIIERIRQAGLLRAGDTKL